jgi:hypothetical protein
MVKFKAIIFGADWVFLTISGYSFIDIMNIFISGNLALSSVENFIKLLLSMAGFVYLCARTYHFIVKSSLDREYRREEIIEKKNQNFPKKWDREFIKPFKEEEK